MKLGPVDTLNGTDRSREPQGWNEGISKRGTILGAISSSNLQQTGEKSEGTKVLRNRKSKANLLTE